MNTEPKSLYSRRRDDIGLAEALAALPPEAQFIGLFYTPVACALGVRQGEEILLSTENHRLDLSQVFEARLFHEQQGELRWQRDPVQGSLGRAVYLTEEKTAGPAAWDEMETLADLDTLENHYLLWGEGWDREGLAEGWSRLALARVGSLAVPLAGLQRKQRVRLHTREYLGLAPSDVGQGRHGNVVVLEERWLKLERFVTGGEKPHG